MEFLVIGLLIGVIASAIGVGGGILLVPILLFLDGDLSHTHVAAISMGSMTLSSLSGSLIYGKKQLIDFKLALLCIVLAFPGTMIGVYLTDFISKEAFKMAFGIGLLIYAPLFYRKSKLKKELAEVAPLKGLYYYISAASSFFIGMVSGLLAIGGGIFYVPMLISIGVDVRRAIGSSLAIITVTAMVGALQHVYLGNLDLMGSLFWLVAVGMILGGQIGPRVSQRLPKSLLVGVMAILLLAMGVYLLVSSI